jgi:hypothetical protein
LLRDLEYRELLPDFKHGLEGFFDLIAPLVIFIFALFLPSF